MCGIGGILRVHSPGAEVPPAEVSIPEAWLDLLDESIKHRGPDGQGRFRDRVARADGSVVDVALVHRRLSIIDLACGAQPMVSAGKPPSAIGSERARSASEELADRSPVDRTFQGLTLPLLFHGRPDDAVAYQPLMPQGGASDDRGTNPSLALRAREDRNSDLIAVVFNGCIYNHRELRAELELLGHVFETDHSDTEVLLHGWRAWGKDLKSRLDSMHAFALWDAANAKLILSRDRFGEKPLYLSRVDDGGLWAFASTPRAIQEISDDYEGRARFSKLDYEDTKRWTVFGYDDYFTPLGGVMSLSAGLMIGAPATERHVLRRSRQGGRSLRRSLPTFRRKKTIVEEFDALITEAVKSRLDADVPLGCFLSGGIDSSLVARAAASFVPRLRTITVRMPEDRYDESRYAEQIAGIIGSDHITVDCDARPAEDLILLIRTLGLPFGDSSLLPTFWASMAAREHVKVVLSGDGGDELFLGYERYEAAEWLELARLKFGLIPTHLLFSGADPKSKLAKIRRLGEAASGFGYIDLLSIFPSSLHKPLMGDVAAPYERPSSRAQAQRYDLTYHLPGDMLRKVDTASMMVDLEVRAPLLSKQIADEALKLPGHVLRLKGQRKGLLRAVARKYFPADIVDRPKMGFAIPIGEWFRSDYGGMRQLLLDHLTEPEPFGPDTLGINALIKMDFVRRMLKEHDDAGAKSIWPWKGRDHSQRLYMLLVLSIWSKWVGGLKRDRAENV